MITIKDVAKKAGVSISTVSYAMNGSSKVSEQTRSKILKAAEDLNFQPNGTAKNLKNKKTNVIGLFINNLGGPFFSELISGIQEVTFANGYNFIACSSYGGDESTAYNFLREKRVDGAIIMDPFIPDEVILRSAKNKMSIVVLDRELVSDYVHTVLIDNYKGAYDAVKHLIDLGYKEIAFLSGPMKSYDNTKRFEGYRKALEENGLSFSKDLYIPGDFTEDGGYKSTKAFLTGRKPPKSVFAANDEMAIGMMRALKENNINVPEDVAIVGFDDIKLASYVSPKLTTVRHPKYELGVLATHMIFKILKGEPVSENVTLSTELMIRESAAKVCQNS